MNPVDTHTLGEALRSVMRRVPSPVTVVTAALGDEVRGVTIGSFTSVSLAPPLVSFNVQRGSQMEPFVRGAARLNVHVLGEDQAGLGLFFAQPNTDGSEALAAVPHYLDLTGTPVLLHALAVLHCRPYELVEAGDHVLVLAEVEAVDGPAEGDPLVYVDRAFHTVGEVRSAADEG